MRRSLSRALILACGVAAFLGGWGASHPLAAQEREEIAIITGYLPRQMSDDDVKAAIAEAITETGAAGMKDMGKVIGVLRARYAGQMDFGKASALVKAQLSG